MKINLETTISEFGFLQTPSLKEESFLHEASALILDKGIKTLPVVNNQGGLIGIVGASDIIRARNITGQTKVHEVMNNKPISVSYNQSVVSAIDIICTKQYVSQNYQMISSLPIVDSDSPANLFLGMFTYKEALKGIKELIGEELVSSIMGTNEVEIIRRDDNIEMAYFIMENRGFRQVLVVEEKKNKNIFPVGVVKDSEILRLMNSESEEESEYFQVEDLMTKLDIFKILTPRHRLFRVIELFTSPELDLKLFPVVSKGNLIGAISYTDVLKFAVEFINTPKE